MDEQTPKESEHGHDQFGNNFFLVFSDLRIKETDPKASASNPFAHIYLDKAEGYGERWHGFIKTNRKLIDQIYQELDGHDVYLDLLTHYKDLLIKGRGEKNYNMADKFESMGLESVGIYVWRKLNPLLKEAAAQMEKQGINPKDFFA